jgi:restriction system protein
MHRRSDGVVVSRRQHSRSGGSGGGLLFLIFLGAILFYNYPALAVLLLIVAGVAWWAYRRSTRYRTMEATELAGLLANVRSMSGAQFEVFVAEVFRAMGHRAQVMGGSGDQGVDVIVATPDGRKIAVQCKNYAKPVGNKPVQEVYAGAKHHGCSQGWVVAPAGFTRGAFELAASVNVSLFDERGIRAWIGQVEQAARAREIAEEQQGGPVDTDRRPRGNWMPHPDDDARKPAQNDKVSMIDGRVVPDTEAYDSLLDLYEEYLGVLEQLYETKREHGGAYESNASVRERWAQSHARLNKSIEGTCDKLDVLEGRNPGLAGTERVSRRARLASRHAGIVDEGAKPSADFADQIRKLAELRDEGILTDEEFEAKKAEILRRA